MRILLMGLKIIGCCLVKAAQCIGYLISISSVVCVCVCMCVVPFPPRTGRLRKEVSGSACPRVHMSHTRSTHALCCFVFLLVFVLLHRLLSSIACLLRVFSTTVIRFVQDRFLEHYDATIEDSVCVAVRVCWV